MTRVTGLSTLDFLLIGLSSSYDVGCEFSELTQLTQFFLIDFFLISSFNIVFYWELCFMIFFVYFLLGYLDLMTQE